MMSRSPSWTIVLWAVIGNAACSSGDTVGSELMTAGAGNVSGGDQTTDGDSGVGGQAGSGGTVPDDGPYFDEQHVLDIDIELTSTDWDALRFEGRDLSALAGDCVAGPPADIYTMYPASVTVDGQLIENVGIRKKGFLGSISQVRPSLKIDFDEFVPAQQLSGMSRMTLNNNKQDGTLIRQCLAYQTFAAAGIPSPRCNFARVTVNGMDLGIYTHVEEVKKPFLRRHFPDDSGNLYEGQRSDFNDVLVATFEAKTNELTNDRSDLAAVVAALANDSVDEVAALVDLDAFYTYWAMEVLVGAWDGYASNRNNFYLYGDPSTGKFRFLPWAPDMAFTPTDPFHPIRAVSVSADGELASKLYAWPETKALYLERVQELLDTVWYEAALLAEVDRMVQLLGAPDADGLTEIRDYIESRQAAVESELSLGGGLWIRPEEAGYCLAEVGTVSATFSTDWGSLQSTMQHTHGTATLDIQLQGEAQMFAAVGAVAGLDESGNPVVRVVGANADGSAVGPQLLIEEGMWQPATEIPYHGFATYGLVFTLDGLVLGAAGFLGSGSVTLDEASRQTGGVVSGNFSGTIYWQPQ